MESAGLRLEDQTAEGADARVIANGKQLRQLLDNLLSNAVRYTDRGGIVRVTLSMLAEPEHGVRLDIEDSAPTVPAADLERLFERFYRVESSRSRATGGSGLGLAICRNIAIANGGTIEAAASELGGLRITTWLPSTERSDA